MNSSCPRPAALPLTVPAPSMLQLDPARHAGPLTPSHPWARRVTETARRMLTSVRDESGAATAEYAIATLAAVGLAGLLVVVLRGDDVKGLLTDIVHRALTSSG